MRRGVNFWLSSWLRKESELLREKLSEVGEWGDSVVARPEDIRIPDLASPELSPVQANMIKAARGMTIEFSEDAVLGAACKATGLSDFGAEDFRERLRVWLQAVEEDSDLGPVGRIGVFRDITRYASNRLRFEDLLRRHPEILNVEIERPIIIAGLPRSGTTHLLNLIASDRRLRSLPYLGEH